MLIEVLARIWDDEFDGESSACLYKDDGDDNVVNYDEQQEMNPASDMDSGD